MSFFARLYLYIITYNFDNFTTKLFGDAMISSFTVRACACLNSKKIYIYDGQIFPHQP